MRHGEKRAADRQQIKEIQDRYKHDQRRRIDAYGPPGRLQNSGTRQNRRRRHERRTRGGR